MRFFNERLWMAASAAVIGTLLATNVRAQDAPSVLVEIAEMRPTTTQAEYVGRTAASENAEIVPQVAGILTKVHHGSGGAVYKGDLLFEIEPDEYKLAVELGQANVDVAAAALEFSEVELARLEKLINRDVVTEVDLLVARANAKKAEAALRASKAGLAQAELQLARTKIRAPFDGFVSLPRQSEGNFVAPSTGPLATVTNGNPMSVSINVPLSTYTDFLMSGSRVQDREVTVILANGVRLEAQFPVTYAAAVADPRTNTVEVSAALENGDGLLLHNQTITIVVTETEPEMRMTIPQQALLLDQVGPYVLVVDDADTVQQLRPELGQTIQNRIEVAGGLPDGSRVIVSGLQKVRLGMTVSATVAGLN